MLWLFGTLGGVLLVASAIGQILRWRAARGGGSATIDNLNARINAWWVMVAVLAAAFVTGRSGVILLFALASALALREYVTVAPQRAGDRRALLLGFAVVLPMQYLLVWIEWYGLFAIFIPVYAFLFLPIVAAFGRDTESFLQRAAEVQWGLMIAVFCISHIPALLTLQIAGFEGRNLLLLAFLLLVVQLSDVLQYIWGKLLGRHKVAPELSPSKTWEGLIGGAASASAIGAGLWWMTPFSPAQAFAIAAAMTALGFLGGLVMSAIKRDRGVKDWGHLIQGHGGVLDRLDSLCFAAPVYFHVVRYWWT
jgi:phosphatidate cytidylyltransferase